MNNKNTLLIFTRNPKLGKVKTRLAKTIGDKKALEIYIFLLEHTAKVTRNSDCEKKVYYSEEMAENDIWETPPFDKKLQMGSDLGIRMMNAFKDSFSVGYEKAIVIGSDLYDITEKHIEEAFSKLDTNDVVIGPAQDGGYYLLGMKKLYPEIFQQKKWGTNTVLRDTLEDLKTVDVALLEELNDVDVYDDIKDHAAFEKFLKK
ncbi:TIGR04282 family arsenosugar biosynthesis glycosyltransferase [Joostella atrarenae]|uniref:TIGR04282 family arsenosugar biosynthesis glycosyltransferase n=1 Tax=Joostella atrarenae TaxID=679257 RepID=A0ABS9J0L3_9FLAO|nr:TIGR04282 family arsenosugar biosynthesis glycosyltransferase [Joostella atrarenae]MCF8713975.1 TIGR04282 family arsenosugar biosynthesis glycosyltransferase [Joostella atrarenae]